MAKKGGKQPGAGRPKGGKNRTTLEKMAVQAELRQRTLRASNKLWNAQYQKAVGSVMVFRVDEIEIGEGKTKKVNTLVTDEAELKAVLDAEANGEDLEVYFVTIVPPDTKAIDSMFDRTFGKAPQSIEIKTERPPEVAAAVALYNNLTGNGMPRAKALSEVIKAAKVNGFDLTEDVILDADTIE